MRRWKPKGIHRAAQGVAALASSLPLLVGCAQSTAPPANEHVDRRSTTSPPETPPTPIASNPGAPASSSAARANPTPSSTDEERVAEVIASSGDAENAKTPGPTEIRFGDHYPEDDAVSLRAWTREHHVSGPVGDATCWELGERIGKPPTAGLLCLFQRQRPPQTLGRIYRVEGKKLRQVWEATLATYLNWLELTPVIAPDGATLVLHDRSPFACEAAISEAGVKAADLVAPPSWKLLGPACAKVGPYVYERGSFRPKRAGDGAEPPLEF